MSTEASSIREEIADLRNYLAGLPENLRTGPYAETYRRRLELLFDQLTEQELTQAAAAASSPALDLRVATQKAPDDHRLPAQFLGDLLQRWQALFWALGQAAAGKPTIRGVIPAEILRETTLDVVAFAEGSFVTRMVLEEPAQTKLPGNGLGLLAFEQFEKLCEVGARHHELSLVLHQLKGRVLSSYAKLLGLLDEWDASLDVTLADPRGSELRRVRLHRDHVRAILPALSQVSAPEEQNEQVVIGFLNAANRRTGTFEIDLGEEGTVSGRVAAGDILTGVTIGQRYEFRLSEVVTKDPLTGSTDASWVLLQVREQDEQRVQ
jgi:hypothetical protein